MIQIDIDGFSGPLDILCHMVENREIEVFKVSVGHIVKVYGEYLSRKGEVPINVIADFLVQAAQLVLGKTLALMPKIDEDNEEDLWEDDGEFEQDVTDLREVLARYMPYRKAVDVLLDLKESCDRRAFRQALPLPPTYDLGDLYSLSSLWWQTLKSRRALSVDDDGDSDSYIEGVPDPIPDEIQVEKRMEIILEELDCRSRLSLSEVLEGRMRSNLVVNLLALLELSRRNRVSLVQEERFSDVLIFKRA